jgi:Ankyrin repeats (3 copies)
MNFERQRMLQDAAWDGRMDILLALVVDPDVHVAGQHSCALLHAAHRGHARAVALLLPLSDPTAHRSEPLLRAASHGHQRCLRMLLPASDTSGWYPHEWAGLAPAARRLIEDYQSGRSEVPVVAVNVARGANLQGRG